MKVWHSLYTPGALHNESIENGFEVSVFNDDFIKEENMGYVLIYQDKSKLLFP